VGKLWGGTDLLEKSDRLFFFRRRTIGSNSRFKVVVAEQFSGEPFGVFGPLLLRFSPKDDAQTKYHTWICRGKRADAGGDEGDGLLGGNSR